LIDRIDRLLPDLLGELSDPPTEVNTLRMIGSFHRNDPPGACSDRTIRLDAYAPMRGPSPR
jgi:hypothetical protein